MVSWMDSLFVRIGLDKNELRDVKHRKYMYGCMILSFVIDVFFFFKFAIALL